MISTENNSVLIPCIEFLGQQISNKNYLKSKNIRFPYSLVDINSNSYSITVLENNGYYVCSDYNLEHPEELNAIGTNYVNAIEF